MYLFDYFGSSGAMPALTEGDQWYDMNEVRETYLARIKSEGFAVVLPEGNQLQIDIDSVEHYRNFLHAAEVIMRNWPFAPAIEIEDHPSSSGFPRRHITLTLPFTVEPWQRIALQAALGSDPIREILSATRLMRGDIHPTLFVETPPGGLIPAPTVVINELPE